MNQILLEYCYKLVTKLERIKKLVKDAKHRHDIGSYLFMYLSPISKHVNKKIRNCWFHLIFYTKCGVVVSVLAILFVEVIHDRAIILDVIGKLVAVFE